jgi:hypothetical protein
MITKEANTLNVIGGITARRRDKLGVDVGVNGNKSKDSA